MGIQDEGGHLSGLLAATSFIPGRGDSRTVLTSSGARVVDEYDRNIQTADLNALNALLAVVNWKKCLGYYADHAPAVETVYRIYTGDIRNQGVMP